MSWLQHPYKGAVVWLQIAALLFLQGYSLLPVYRAFHGDDKECFQNHRLCGCAPGRIADKTCCCFKNVNRCCAAALSEASEDPFALHEEEEGHCEASAMPCGGYSDSATELTGKAKFLVTSFVISPLIADASVYPPCPSVGFSRYSPEPPVPPPRLVTSV